MTDEQTQAALPHGEAPGTRPAPAKPRAARPVRPSRPWGLWLLVLALCGAVGVLYLQQTQLRLSQSASLRTQQENSQQLSDTLNTAQNNMRSELQAQVGLLQDSSSSLQQALSDLQEMEQQDEQRVLGLQQRIERQLQDTRTLVAALQGQVAVLQQRDTRWLNAEAAYLMRLAEHKLTLEHNPQTALQLLQSVDGLLRDQLDPLAQTARHNLLQDIAAIESVRIPDRLLLALRINDIAAALNEISVTGARQQVYQQGLGAAREQTTVVAQEQGWTAAVINLLRSIFVWRQLEQSALECLPPEQESLIKQQLRLQLEQARLAIVQADQALFEEALHQVAIGLQAYFVQESATAARLLDDVRALAAQRVVAELPDVSATRALVEQLQGAQSSQEQQPPQVSQNTQSTQDIQAAQAAQAVQESTDQENTDQESTE